MLHFVDPLECPVYIIWMAPKAFPVQSNDNTIKKLWESGVLKNSVWCWLLNKLYKQGHKKKIEISDKKCLNHIFYLTLNHQYRQTWVNDHLRIATTCLQRPPFWGLILNFHSINDPRTTTTCPYWPQFWCPEGGRSTGLTVHVYWICPQSWPVNVLPE